MLIAAQRILPASTPASVETPTKKTGQPPTVADSIGSLLTREQSIERAELAMDGRALSGVAAKVIAYVGTARMDLSDLAGLIGRDSMLTVRVLQTANSAAYTSNRGAISTLTDAVRMVGSATVRDIAASAAVFDAMPLAEADGFNPIQCWQHSLAVAMLCTHLAAGEQRGLAYLVGLCHNLGEVLFRTHFGTEYRLVLDAENATKLPRRELERRMLGITRGELVEKILEKLELPPVIRRPIIAFHRSSSCATDNEPFARMLHLADQYATATMLSSPDESVLQPVTRVDCRAATGKEDPPPPNGDQFRNEILSMTAMYARLEAGQQAGLIAAFQDRKQVRICLARDATLSTFDPVAAALGALAEITICDALPAPDKLADYRGLIVLARHTSVRGFTAQDIAMHCNKSDGTQMPTLWLTGRKSENLGAKLGDHSPIVWPISVNLLADFIQKL